MDTLPVEVVRTLAVTGAFRGMSAPGNHEILQGEATPQMTERKSYRCGEMARNKDPRRDATQRDR